MAIATDIADAVKRAVADPSVRAIALVIDSPGGEVGGIDALARTVADASRVKPTIAFGDDLLASAAYWIASQTSRIYANPVAQVGSIGTYGVVADWSGFFEKEGVKIHVVRAGQFKGAGVVGTQIEKEQLAEFQRTVDSVNAEFLRAVARGRRLPMARVKELADGRVHIAADALKLGLIDEVADLDNVLVRLKAGTAGQSLLSMGPRASIGELREAVPAADVSFLIEARKGSWTAEGAAAEFARRGASQPASLGDLRSALPATVPLEFVSECRAGAMTVAQARVRWAEREVAARKTDAEKQHAAAESERQQASRITAEWWARNS
jgi:signal peptide peptidase SppA